MAADCSLSAYIAACGVRNAGGVKKVFIGKPDEFTFTLNADGNVTVITAVTPGNVFYQITPRQNSAKFDEPRSGDFTANTSQFDGTLTFEVVRRNVTFRNLYEQMNACSCGLIVAWEENTGDTWIMGHIDGERAYLSGGTGSTTGAIKADANGYTIVFKAEQLNQAASVIPSIPI